MRGLVPLREDRSPRAASHAEPSGQPFHAHGDWSLPPGTGPRELNSQDLADFSFFSLATRTGTGLSHQGPVPESNTCAQSSFCRPQCLRGPVSPARDRSLPPGTSPREQNLSNAGFHQFALRGPTSMHFGAFDFFGFSEAYQHDP
uniref:Uncharacterized protein n=1 Tax=Ananas comosus var. bracteatus TaxID=296719 RepID=A0A6V7NWN9_ANACO|nr:unnamed protein product [Ananas comosus var. bracteatus]